MHVYVRISISRVSFQYSSMLKIAKNIEITITFNFLSESLESKSLRLLVLEPHKSWNRPCLVERRSKFHEYHIHKRSCANLTKIS